MDDPGPARGPGVVMAVNTSPGGVPKQSVKHAWVDSLGLEGDGHASPTHGGPEKAVSLYAVEAIERVRADGHTAFPGSFGENLTLAGLDWSALGAGDRLEVGVGGLVLELTKPASPCKTLAHWFVGERIARISHKVQPEDARWYALVLSEGPVAPGDAVRRVPATTPEAVHS
jgi:MOSC domain-containing protein YiiM